MAVARVTFTYTLYGSVLQNVMHFYKADYITADLAALANNLKLHWMDVYANLLVAETVLISIHCEKLQSGGGGDVYNQLLTGNGGAGNDRRVPLMMSLVCQLRTGLGGRRNRGRIFIPCQSSAYILDGVFATSWLSTAQGYINTLASRWGPTGTTYDWYLVIHGPSDGPDEGRAVTTMQLRALPGCQRRRELGVGI